MISTLKPFLKKLLILLIWGHFAAFSQQGRIEQLTISDGLSQGFISAIVQDKEGFMWFGTLYGLNRYDGYHFKSYFHDAYNPYLLPNNFITYLFEDSRGWLWVGTEAGLRVFDKKTGRFVSVCVHNKGKVFEEHIYRIKEDTQGNMLIWETASGQWKLSKAVTNELGKDSCATFESATLLKKREEEVFFPVLATPGTGTYGEDNTSYVYPDGKNGHYRFVGKTIYHFPAGTDVQDMSNKKRILFETDQLIQSPYVDRSGIIWVGTNGRGIRKCNPNTTLFTTWQKGVSIKTISAFADDHVLLSLENSVQTLSRKADQMVQNPLQRYLPRSVTEKVFTDRQGTIWWMAVFPYGIGRLDTQGKFDFFPLTNRKGYYIALLETDERDLLAVSSNGRVIRVSSAGRRLESFELLREADPYIVTSFTVDNQRTLWLGTKKGLYQTTLPPPVTDTLIPLLKRRTGPVVHFVNQPDNRNSLSENYVMSLLPDPRNEHLLWIGTKGGGLNKLDTRTGHFEHITIRDGLPDNLIYGILDDKDGNLWMSTNKGLCRFSPQTGAFKVYTEADGLQSNEFNTNAYFQNRKGELFFGGVNGLNIFDPQKIAGNSVPPPVFITNLKVNGREIGEDTSGEIKNRITPVEFLKKIELPHNQNNIELDFAALDFNIPSKNRYRYRLQGADPNWIESGTVHSVNYSHLSPGNYTFEVFGTNNDGVWSKNPARLQIVILPPWWQTWWAYLMYALAAVLFVATYLRQRVKHLRIVHQADLKRQEAERLKEIDSFKSHFFTNVTHEFRTPLTVILGASAQLEEKVSDGLRDKVQLIRQSGQNLLYLINQILDLSKIEANQMTVHPVQGDIVAYLRYVLASFQSLANRSNILLLFETAEPAVIMDYDPEKMRQIVSNLLSNALKFTISGGRVTLQVSKQNESNSRLILKITDTGMGISAEALPHIFERYFQVQNYERQKAGGTGIGLSFTRELVKLMSGEISVRSEIGVGSTFQVVLPITQTAPLNKQETVINQAFLTVGNHRNEFLKKTDKGPVVLLIEDNPEVVDYLSSCLAENYRLAFAYNGRIGIERAFEIVPDLIISDVMMPEKDGYEVCDALKKDTRTSHIPIVLLTAKAGNEDRVHGLKRGADVYLSKPFYQEELLVQIERLLEKQKINQVYFSRLSLAQETVAAVPEAEMEDLFLLKLRTFLEENSSDSTLTSEVICRAMGMGRTNLHNKLTALTGMPLMTYLRTLRLNRAKILLQNSTLRISEIAYQVGFDDPKHFSRVFSEEFGIPPSAIRKT